MVCKKNNTVIKAVDWNICGKKEKNQNCFSFERENDSCHQIKGVFLGDFDLTLQIEK